MNNNTEEDIRVEKDINGEDKYIFDPFNPLNIEITETDILNVLHKYGIIYKIHNFEEITSIFNIN